MNIENELVKLQQAKDREDEKIKLLVLTLLHLEGIMAVDALTCALDAELEHSMMPAPRKSWN